MIESVGITRLDDGEPIQNSITGRFYARDVKVV